METKIDILTGDPITCDLWVAVLLKNRIPCQLVLEKTASGANRALIDDLRKNNPAFANYPYFLDAFVDEISVSNCYSMDWSHHSLPFLPDKTGKLITHITVLAKYSSPIFWGYGTSREASVNDLISRMKEKDSVSEELETKNLHEEFMSQEQGLLGESKVYGFNSFELSAPFPTDLIMNKD